MTSHVGEDPYTSTTFGQSLSLRVDGGFNAVSISPSGRDVVLGSRKGLYVIDLDDPFCPPRWLYHMTSWEVADIQWSPHPSKPYWVASTSNQRVIVWNLSKSYSNAIEHVLHSHSRATTDINFHPAHPEILATCSIDTYVHVWDLRSPQRPYYTTSDWHAGASQVKWNFKNSNILASSHANKILIWDLRKGCSPLYKLQEHEGSINSIDFNRNIESELMSSSNDGTVKFWDFEKNNSNSTYTINTEFPVWRGRYLPFGNGCCIMPMVGGNNAIYLVNDKNRECDEKVSKLQPVYSFKGHTDYVTDFLWRSRHGIDTYVDDREFQFVTWSKDCDLRLWPVSEITYDKVGFKRGKKLETKLVDYEYVSYRKEPENNNKSASNIKIIRENFVTKSGINQSQNKNKVNHLTWLSGVKMHHDDSPNDFFEVSTLQNLGEEVSSVGHKFPKIIFEKISVSTGILVLTLNGPWIEGKPNEYLFMRIEITFPAHYPERDNSPTFKIEENRDLSEIMKQHIIKTLKEISKKYTDLNKYCLEPCLRFLLGEIVNCDMLGDENDHFLNFNISDHIGINDYSSIPSSEEDLGDISDESSISNDDNMNKNSLSTTKLIPFHGNIAFDSTPVPNECGCIWMPTGHLICFFVADNKEKKQQNMWKLGHRGFNKLVKDKHVGDHNPEVLYNENSKENDNSNRPKRYVDLISTSSIQNSDSGASDTSSDSDNSNDSIDDDWNDILKNDITLRTKLPMGPYNLKGSLLSMPSDSGKLNDCNKKIKNVISIHDFRHLIPDKIELALEYRLLGESQEILARHNADIAEKYGYDEIAHCWRMIANLLIDTREANIHSLGWNQDGITGKWFVKEMMEYFERTKNLQMLAMISSLLVIPGKPEVPEINVKPKEITDTIKFHTGSHIFGDSLSGPYQLSHENLNTPNALNYSIQQGRPCYMSNNEDTTSIKSDDYFTTNHHSSRIYKSRSSSTVPYNYFQNDHQIPDIKIEILHDDVLDLLSSANHSLLDPEDETKYRNYRYQYAELLYHWGLPIHRVKLLKFSINKNTKPELVDKLESYNNMNGMYKGVCASWFVDTSGYSVSQHCNYCGLKTKRRIFICGNCQHILHANCASEWWNMDDECPSGCGCKCLDVFDIG